MMSSILTAGGSSPALAAPVVRVVDSLPALAAPESAQLRFTLADALKYRRYVWSVSTQFMEVATKVRKKGNAATHYYRKIFTLKDGTPLINFLDFFACRGLQDHLLAGSGRAVSFRQKSFLSLESFGICWSD